LRFAWGYGNSTFRLAPNGFENGVPAREVSQVAKSRAPRWARRIGNFGPCPAWGSIFCSLEHLPNERSIFELTLESTIELLEIDAFCMFCNHVPKHGRSTPHRTRGLASLGLMEVEIVRSSARRILDFWSPAAVNPQRGSRCWYLKSTNCVFGAVPVQTHGCLGPLTGSGQNVHFSKRVASRNWSIWSTWQIPSNWCPAPSLVRRFPGFAQSTTAAVH
jgi:hypothetical protein